MMHLDWKNEDRKNLMHMYCLALALLQADLLCAALVLLPPIPTRDTTASTPHRSVRRPSPTRPCCPVPAAVRNDRRRYRALLPEALLSHRSMRTLDTPSSRVVAIPCALFGTAETAPDDHAADGSRAPVMPAIGGGDGDARLDNYDLEAETQQLLSMPTIDIKLELQMRGVEHRDLFEKIELAKRLAESRASSSCSAEPCPPPSHASGQARDRVEGDRTSSVRVNGGEGLWRRPLREETEGSASPSSAADGDRKEELDDLYARDVSIAMRVGKQAVTRELNAMGITHSRLSSLTFLARQYATERRKARTEAGETPPSFPASSGAEGADKKARGQRGKGPSREIWTRGAGAGEKEAGHSPQALRRHGGEDLDEEEGASEVTIQSSEGRERMSLGGDFTKAAGMRAGLEVGGGGIDCSPDGHGGGGEKSHGGEVEVTAGQGGVVGSRRREASLKARVDSMSSRELMRALDALGARYRIPAPRSELQAAFASAILESWNEIGTAAGAGNARSATLDDRRSRSDIVPLDPYAEEEEGVKRGRRRVDFDSYNSALSWARQLTFDDILEELRFRGLQHDPRAGFGSLARTLAKEVLSEEQLLADVDSKVAYESELENAMAMSAQEIIRTLREGGEQADVTSSQEELAEKLVAMRLRYRGAPHAGTDGSRRGEQSDTYGESGNRYRQRAREGRRRGGGSDDSKRKARSGSSGFGAGIGGWLRPSDDGYDRGEDNTLLELEGAVRSVGGAAWRAAREAGSLFADTAAGLIPEAFPEDETVGAPGTARAAADRGRPREVGMGAPQPGVTERARAAGERAEDARRAASSFAQSSANSAGLAVARSAANGFLRGAEAAADWAGGGALAREYVLLIVAAFCLVFKRGIGASIALLFVIRAGRIALQKLVTEGRAGERLRQAARGGQQAAVTAGASSAPGRVVGSSPTAASGRRGTAFERESRRNSRQSQTKKQRARRKTRARASRAERSKAKTRADDSGRGRSLWEESDDGSDGGCVVM